jgi:hypothetical protein
MTRRLRGASSEQVRWSQLEELFYTAGHIIYSVGEVVANPENHGEHHGLPIADAAQRRELVVTRDAVAQRLGKKAARMVINTLAMGDRATASYSSAFYKLESAAPGGVGPLMPGVLGIVVNHPERSTFAQTHYMVQPIMDQRAGFGAGKQTLDRHNRPAGQWGDSRVGMPTDAQGVFVSPEVMTLAEYEAIGTMIQTASQ